MLELIKKLENINSNKIDLKTIFKPLFFRINKKSDFDALSKLLDQPAIQVFDFINDQLKELIKIKNPSIKFTSAALESAVNEHLSDQNKAAYGVWVFYPWSNKLVHILDEEEFIEVRTSRNQYKITKAEREILASKKIGVIGLSVGQSVSLTLAMERICGELRLADFDILELTNLNRIRTGVHNLGLLKVYAVAREIAEIDPFIQIKCFESGVTDQTIDSFFSDGGNLDLLIEESDGFDIKILSRYKAKELGIPVLMEASDRCMVDVERFDLEPTRPILHGLVNHLDMDTLRSLKTTEEKIPYMLDILGLETSSLRLKASMLEIEQSINTWPQLASSVTMGGGIAADVGRRILLNSFTESGRYHVDIEELIGNKKPNVPIDTNEHLPVFETTDFKLIADRLAIDFDTHQVQLSLNQIEEIVTAACKAPSGGNSQPWRWVYKNQTLLLFNAFDGNMSYLGFGNFASIVAFGAAAENVVLKAGELGFETKVEEFPSESEQNLIALFRFYKTSNENFANNSLAKGIDLRLTNRKLGNRIPIEPEIYTSLTSEVSLFENLKVDFYSEPSKLDAIADILGELEKLRLLDKQGHIDFVNEIRWTKEEAEVKMDGVDLRTIDLSSSEKVGLEVARNESVVQLVNNWNGGGAFKKLTKNSVDAAGAIGIITCSTNTASDFFNGGRALQRVWLKANLIGVAFQPMAASVFVYARLINGEGINISQSIADKLRTFRPKYEATLNLTSDKKELFIFRLAKADQPIILALRKPLNEVFYFSEK